MSSFSDLADDFDSLFVYRPVIFSDKDVESLIGVLQDCISSKDDTSYINLIFEDYKSHFNTQPVINDDKELVMNIISKSIDIDVDLVRLYNKGLGSEFIDLIVWSIKNKNLLSDILD